MASLQARSPDRGNDGLIVASGCLLAGVGAIVAAASGHANLFHEDVLRLAVWLVGPVAAVPILDREPRQPIGLVLAASGLFPVIAVVTTSPGLNSIPNIMEAARPDRLAALATVALGVAVLVTFPDGQADVLARRRRRWLHVLALTAVLALLVLVGLTRFAAAPLWAYGPTAVHAAAVAGVTTLLLKEDLPDVGFALVRLALLIGVTGILVVTYALALASLSWTPLPSYPSAAAALTALAAVGLLPLYVSVRDRLAVRLYGAGKRPDMVLTLLGQSLDTAGEAEDALRAACDAVAAAVRSPAALVHLGGQAPLAPEGAISLPLQAGGTVVGTLVVAPRRPGEPYSRREIDLITTLAATLAQVARAVGLAGALEAARRETSVQRLDERRRLRRDLHDGLGPLLASLGLRLDALERAAPTSLSGEVATLKDVVATSRREVRRLVDGLEAEDALRSVDLEQALAELVDGWSSATAPLGLHLNLEVAGPIPDLPSNVRTAVYRIAGEAITNVVRHARATSCAVLLGCGSDREIVLEVRDNGVGLGTSRPGVGLRSMQERAATVGGHLETGGHGDGGTLVRFTLVEAATGATR